ncbi:spore germination protein [Paenibacillus sp. UNCCL117]|uniref:GerAB/ArcD/ProY family transporter n=1 Tax=unclassified Paenibacillus TaxID=185978 RepID=UPI00088B8BF2|nr:MULTISPECIES: endospore germination permease [unclassified Paenibacillus]SDC66156.1 spore germination protein [Paenibacillus sp. cl123]SFW22964.1 spore germination protein [Paenibacillus sp. UNCCL117]
MTKLDRIDRQIGKNEMTATVSSMTIAVGILTLPRELAKTTHSSDGWLSILLAGLLAMGFGWVLGKLAVRMNGLSFLAFMSKTITKPLAWLLTAGMSFYFMLFAAYEMRAVANISKQYLFERTPTEVISLTFLLVVVYAVSGSRVGLVRLNTLFLPSVIVVALAVLFFSLGNFYFEELKPFFISDWRELLAGARSTIFSLLGFEVILFYTALMSKPQDAPGAAVKGVGIAVVLYLLVYVVGVGVFSRDGLKEVTYPAIELAKEVQVPGEFFERFESFFFVIWIMAIFNSAKMAFDISAMTLKSLFPGIRRFRLIVMLAPVIYLIGMFPRNGNEFMMLGEIISYAGTVILIVIPSLIYAWTVIRGRGKHAR